MVDHRSTRLATAIALAALVTIGAGCGTSSKKDASTTTRAPRAATTVASSTTSTANSTASAALSIAAAPPKGVAPGNWGDQTTVVATKAGNPVIAFTHEDLGNDGRLEDGALLVTTFDPTTKTWSTPATIAKGNLQPGGDGSQISAAADAVTGLIAVAFADQGSDDVKEPIKVALSSDDAKTWTTVSIPSTEDALYPRVALGQGQLAVSYTTSDGVRLALATEPATTGTPAPKFTLSSVPKFGALAAAPYPSAAAIGPDGKAHVAYTTESDDDSNRSLVVWTEGTPAPVKVLDSKKHQNDVATVALATYKDEALVVASSLTTSDDDDEPVARVSRSSDNGKTWSDPAPVAGDAASGPFSLALAVADSALGALVYVPNSGGGDQQCGNPKIATSTDGEKWTPCLVIPGDSQPDSTFYPAVATGADDTLWVAFGSTGESAGVTLWTVPSDPSSQAPTTTEAD